MWKICNYARVNERIYKLIHVIHCVHDGARSYPLEAVKALKGLIDADTWVNPRLVNTSMVSVCNNPVLAQAFYPLCQGKGAAMVFSKLADAITPPDPCEICAHPACFGHLP
uniref:Guanylate cyclase activator 2B n=1 Tax=Hucho hucho TaxID=62062 RepID=A0A4W5Q4M4_9TELE